MSTKNLVVRWPRMIVAVVVALALSYSAGAFAQQKEPKQKAVSKEEMSLGQEAFAKAVSESREAAVEKSNRKEKVVAQAGGQEDRIQELERRLESVTDELQELRSQGIAEDRLKSIEEKIGVLADEIENIKQAAVIEEPTYEQVFGRAPAASKVYLVDQGLSIGGYGELAISQFIEDADNIIDAQRAILYVGYKFTDRIIFNSEIEFEHATTGENLDERDGSVSVEFASLDFLVTDYLNFRGGLLLIPLGILNEVHEPTTFFGVLRPDVERNIIPTTFRENGAGIFGDFDTPLGGLSYRAYVVNSLDSRGFRASNFRSGRPQGNQARFNDPAFTGRVEYDPIPGLKFGGSLFLGNTGQNETVAGEKIDGFFQLYEADVQLQFRGLEARALFAYTLLDDAELINAQLADGIVDDFGLDDSVGEEQYGFYVEAGYNILSLTNFGQYFQYFAPFVRYEMYDTQFQVPDGFESNPANDRRLFTVGFSYKPIPNVVLKADYQFRDNEADSARDQFNLGLGYVF